MKFPRYKKTIFLKLFLSYVFLLLIAISIAGLLQLTFTKNYFLSSKEKELNIRSQDLAQIVQPLLAKGENPSEAVANFNRTDRILGTEAWVFNNTGTIIATSAEHLHCEGNTLETADIEKLMLGEVLITKGQSQYFDETVIRAAAPVFEKGNFLGGVILYSPVSGVNKTTQQMARNYFLTAIIGTIVALTLGYFISKYVTQSLNKISKVAHSISDGNFKERVNINSDDELGMLGDSINQMTRRLERFDNIRTEFIANVSHELRSPLTSVQGFIEALIDKRNSKPEEQQHYLSIIQQETYRLNNLINDLLEISRFDSDAVKLDIDPFPISIVVERGIASLKPKLLEKKLIVETVITKDLPLCNGDEDRVEQIFHNLLDNAIRYSPNGSKIIISCRLKHGAILVDMTDFGPGIPSEELKNIWERFYKVDKSRSRNRGGTGLGLAIVQEIVKKHGGTISVESTLDQGTTFSFSLPILNVC
ncbi:MAG: sensor histidine kinase [Bacillota bacterium]